MADEAWVGVPLGARLCDRSLPHGYRPAMTSDVLELEERRWSALLSNDLEAIDELFHPQLTYTHSNAVVDSKEVYMANLSAGVVRYVACDREDTQVVEIGDVASITGKATFSVQVGERNVTIASRYSSVWLREDGVWRFFVWHNTPVPS